MADYERDEERREGRDDRDEPREERRDERRASPDRSKKPTRSNVLGVFGLSTRTTEKDLEDEFSRVGSVDKVAVVYDQREGRSRGFAFITMKSEDDAGRCIEEINGKEIGGRPVRVDYSYTKEAHRSTPGEYMGKPTYPRGDRYGGPPRRGGDDRYARRADTYRRDDRQYDDRREPRRYDEYERRDRDRYDDYRSSSRRERSRERSPPRRSREEYDDRERRY